MKLYSWNVNGIRAIEKKGIIDWVLKTQPDILCLQETKAHPDQLNDELKNIKGYKSYFASAEKKGYSGTALYTKEEPLEVEYGMGIDLYDNEGRIITAKYADFTLLNIYFPNGQMSEDRLAFKLGFYEELLEYINERVSLGEKIIVCGDYNTAHHAIDLKNPKPNEKTSGFLPIERAWMDKLVDNGYVDTFRHFYPEEIKYSWWSYRFSARKKNVGWRIDYFFVSENAIDMVDDAEILNDVEGSDHCPVTLTLKI